MAGLFKFIFLKERLCLRFIFCMLWYSVNTQYDKMRRVMFIMNRYCECRKIELAHSKVHLQDFATMATLLVE